MHVLHVWAGPGELCSEKFFHNPDLAPKAYVCDISSTKNLAANLGIFMGVSAGVGFIVGIPLSAILMTKAR